MSDNDTRSAAILRWQRLTRAVAVIGALISLGWLVHAMSAPSWFALALGGWVTLPFVLAWGAVHLLRKVRGTLVSLGITTAATAMSAWVYYDVLIVHPDAQGALSFLFLPLWQSLGIALGAVVAIVLDALSPSQPARPA